VKAKAAPIQLPIGAEGGPSRDHRSGASEGVDHLHMTFGTDIVGEDIPAREWQERVRTLARQFEWKRWPETDDLKPD